MAVRPPLTVPVHLTLTRIPALTEDVAQVKCHSCRHGLDVYQPETAFPDRLLGVCQACRHWYVIDLMPGQGAAVMVLLPPHGSFEKVEDRYEDRPAE
jgi:hypothetical protein